MRKIISIVSVVLMCNILYAQRSELGILAGTSYYLGDINTSSQFYNPKIAGGIIYRYNLNPHWALKLNALYGRVEASDADFDNIRNLSFRSDIFEISSQVELNFLGYFTGSKKHRFTPYIFAGIGFFHFNPQAYWVNPATNEGKWYDLQPLGLEGQGYASYPERKPYSLTEFTIPFGLGVKYSVSKAICIGAEWGIRKTFTDYIDDISTAYIDKNILLGERGTVAVALADRTPELVDPTTLLPYPPHLEGESRGNSSTKDWYSFAGVFITFKLGYKAKPSCFEKGFNYKENIYY